MPEVSSSRYLVTATWDDVPHLSAAAKRELWNSTPPYMRDARAKGIPALGAGAIYPVPESEITVDPFPIPAHWLRAYALDVGWNRTAGLWGAWEPGTGMMVLYAEHYRAEAQPSTHAAAIRARGEWIKGVVDPAAHGRSQNDGKQLIADYRELGLDLTPADNAVESGLHQVWEALSTGQLRVFSTLQHWFGEYRLYHRDEKGVIVKKNDHLMDTTRYLVRSGRSVAAVRPPEMSDPDARRRFPGAPQRRPADSRTGY